MNTIERLVETAIALGTAYVLEQLAITAGEISQRQALKIYGAWFKAAVDGHRIRPVRVEDGHAGTRWYRVTDILALKTQEAARAEILERKHTAQ